MANLPDVTVSPADLLSGLVGAPSAPSTILDPAPPKDSDATTPERRWRIDGWAVWRPGSGLERVASGGPMAPAYGGTQSGIVARRRLGAGAIRPDAYVRLTYSPERPSQGNAAVGLSARPVGGLPVRVHAEARLTRDANEVAVRPAVFAVSEFAPIDLPLALTAEGYAQGGWVGGRYATPFVDGQLRIERPVTRIGPATLRMGAGAWGGAQKFAGRLDAGPSLTLDMRGGPVPVRASLDYRVRVAGNARPGNGIAVTLSTGF